MKHLHENIQRTLALLGLGPSALNTQQITEDMFGDTNKRNCKC